MAEITIEADFTVKASQMVGERMSAEQVQHAITERMANALLGGMLGANDVADFAARSRANETYVMVMTMFEALTELKR